MPHCSKCTARSLTSDASGTAVDGRFIVDPTRPTDGPEKPDGVVFRGVAVQVRGDEVLMLTLLRAWRSIERGTQKCIQTVGYRSEILPRHRFAESRIRRDITEPPRAARLRVEIDRGDGAP